MKKIDINTIINYLILLYAFLLPLHRGMTSIIGESIMVLFFFQKDIKEKLNILKKNNFFTIFTLLFLYGTIVAFWSPSTLYGFNYAIKKFISLLPVFVIFLSIRKEFIEHSISAFLSGLFVSEIISYGIFLHLWQTKFNKLYVSAHFADPTPFMEHTLYSLYLSIGILILFFSILKNWPSKKNIFLFFFFVTMTINLFITGGRGGQLAFFVTLLILFILQKEKKYFLLIPIPIIIFLLAYWFSPLFHSRILNALHSIELLINNFDFCTSWGIRASAWLITWDIFKEHWLIGVGYQGYMEYLKQFINHHECFKCIYGPLSKHLHNQYLTMIAEGGIIYLGLYLYMLLTLFKITIKNKFINNIKYIFLINFVLLGFTEPIFHMSWTMHLFVFFVGIILAQRRIESLSP